MSKPFIVGLRGPIGVGKTTLARALASPSREPLQAHAVYVESFAAPIRDGLEVMGITKDRFPDAYRRAAQIIGTDIGRKMIHEDHWVEQAEWRIMALPHPGIVVFDDVRFRNEIAFCDLCLYLRRGGVGVKDGHSSEDLASDPFDHIVIDLDTTSPASVLSLILEHRRHH